MSFQKKRRLSKYVLTFFTIVVFLSCVTKKEKNRIVAIVNAVKVESDDYYFSDDADIYIGGDKYSFRDKIEYDSMNEIERFLMYYPDGLLRYSKSDLEKDPKLFSLLDCPKVNSFVYKDGIVSDGKGGIYEVEKLDGIYLKLEKKGNNVVFYILGS